MEDSSAVVKDIMDFYHDKQSLKRLKEIAEKHIKSKFTESESDMFETDDYVVHYKKRTKYKFKEEIYDYLEEHGLLPLSVNVQEVLEAQYNIEHAKLDPEKYVKLQPKRLNKEQTAIRNKKEELFDDSVSKLQLTDLLLIYSKLKKEYDKMEDKYEFKRKVLLRRLKKEGIDTLSSDIGTFNVYDRKSEYDIDAIFQGPVEKKLSYTYSVHNGLVHCLNSFTGRLFSFAINEDTEDDGHIISISNHHLFVDGIPLEIVNRPSEENDYTYTANGKFEIESLKFFRSCPISSTKLEELSNLGYIPKKVLESFKFVEGEDDITVYPEVISKENDSKRKQMFFQRILHYSRLREEKNKTIQTLEN